MFILSYVLMVFYSYILSLIIVPILCICIVISLYIFKKSKDKIEEKRSSEYTYICSLKDSFLNEKYKEENVKKDVINKLKDYQTKDYVLEKINIVKRLVFSTFQSILICMIVLFYFTKLYEILSIGSLIALINLITLILQPLLNICSEITMFSNYKLIYQRIEDINNNIK